MRILKNATLACAILTATATSQQQIVPAVGRAGGTLTLAENSDPQTFNPIFAADSASRLIAMLTQADLMHINPRTLKVEPALATNVEHRSDRDWIVHLREGVRFSDGTPLTADDVAFSFQVYTDAKIEPPQRELLTLQGNTVTCRALDTYRVEITLPAPAAAGDRLLDSLWILPRHRLQPAYVAGQLQAAWDPSTPPELMAGLGPYRVAAVTSGQEVRLERNPYYWRTNAAHQPLPMIQTIRLRDVSDPNLRLTLFMRGELDAIEDLHSQDYASLLHKSCCRALDAGAGLDPIVMTMNQSPGGSAAREWFRLPAFRQAVSLAIDRSNLTRNVFGGHASSLASLTSPAEGSWADPTPASVQSIPQAVKLLQTAGFQIRQGKLYDSQGRAVTFSLIAPSTNADRQHIAVFVQEDLRRIGIAVEVVPLDFNTYVERLIRSRDYESAIVGIGPFGDADPNVEGSLWALDGSLHLWNMNPSNPAPWEKELDSVFKRQLTLEDQGERLSAYRSIQAIEREQLPLIPLVAPDVLMAAKPGLVGVDAALLAPHLLWNVETLSWADPRAHP